MGECHTAEGRGVMIETKEGLQSLTQIVLELAGLLERHLTEGDQPSGALPEKVRDVMESLGYLQAGLSV